MSGGGHIWYEADDGKLWDVQKALGLWITGTMLLATFDNRTDVVLASSQDRRELEVILEYFKLRLQDTGWTMTRADVLKNMGWEKKS